MKSWNKSITFQISYQETAGCPVNSPLATTPHETQRALLRQEVTATRIEPNTKPTQFKKQLQHIKSKQSYVQEGFSRASYKTLSAF